MRFRFQPSKNVQFRTEIIWLRKSLCRIQHLAFCSSVTSEVDASPAFQLLICSKNMLSYWAIVDGIFRAETVFGVLCETLKKVPRKTIPIFTTTNTAYVALSFWAHSPEKQMLYCWCLWWLFLEKKQRFSNRI